MRVFSVRRHAVRWNTMLQRFTESSFTKIRSCYFVHTPSYAVGRQVVVGIAIRYVLDRPGFEFRWRRNFLHPYYLITSVAACSPGGDFGGREFRPIVFGRCEPVDAITGLCHCQIGRAESYLQESHLPHTALGASHMLSISCSKKF